MAMRTHASLFSGIGGAELAAEWMGWKNVFHCEINPFGRKVLEYWYPNSISYEDITKTDFSEWRGKVNVLTGGFPCQPFSVAGKRRGSDDDRYLWPEMLRVIREVQPSWIVGENVAGILTMVQPGEETCMGCQTNIFGEVDRKRELLRQEYVIEIICGDLEREGYSVQPFVIPACAVGAPHRRDRVWIIAHRADAGAETMQCGPTVMEDRRKPNGDPNRQKKLLSNLNPFSVQKLLHTPTAAEVRHERRVQELKQAGGETFHSRANGETRPNGLVDFMDFHGLLPTPAAQDGKNSMLPPSQSDRDTLPGYVVKNCQPTDGATFQLNPLFVEEMMGFPSDWLVSPFQDGDKNP